MGKCHDRAMRTAQIRIVRVDLRAPGFFVVCAETRKSWGGGARLRAREEELMECPQRRVHEEEAYRRTETYSNLFSRSCLRATCNFLCESYVFADKYCVQYCVQPA